MVKWKIRRRSYFVPPLIYFIPPLSLRFLPPFSPFFFLLLLFASSTSFFVVFHSFVRKRRADGAHESSGHCAAGHNKSGIEFDAGEPPEWNSRLFFPSFNGEPGRAEKNASHASVWPSLVNTFADFFFFLSPNFPPQFLKNSEKSAEKFFSPSNSKTREYSSRSLKIFLYLRREYEFRRGSQISIRTFFSSSTNEQANEWRSQFVLDIFPLSPPGSLICINHAWDSSFGTRLFAPTPAE